MHYLALSDIRKETINEIFGTVQFIEYDAEIKFITSPLSELELSKLLKKASDVGADLCSHIRCL